MDTSIVVAAARNLMIRRNELLWRGQAEALEPLYERNTTEGERAFQDACRLVWAMRESAGRRGARYLGQRTNIAVQPVALAGGEARISLVERSRFFYRQGGRFFDEQIHRPHRILLKRRSRRGSMGPWKIAADDCPQETARLDGLPPGSTDVRPIAGGSSEMDAMGLRLSPETPGGISYNRAAVRDYAARWWNGANPAYRTFGVDCTNFVSQSVRAGDAPMTFGARHQGWWYRGPNNQWSFSWSVAHSLRWYLGTSRRGLRATEVERARDLRVGDVISYDFTGDGHFEHSTVVVGHDAAGEPLVAAHTASAFNRFWDYQTSPAFSQNIVYKFFHVADVF